MGKGSKRKGCKLLQVFPSSCTPKYSQINWFHTHSLCKHACKCGEHKRLENLELLHENQTLLAIQCNAIKSVTIWPYGKRGSRFCARKSFISLLLNRKILHCEAMQWSPHDLPLQKGQLASHSLNRQLSEKLLGDKAVCAGVSTLSIKKQIG